MITAQVFIEHQLDTHTSFGVRYDTGERVFINSKLAKKYNINEDQVRELTLLPNSTDTHSDTPWRAVGVSVQDAADNLVAEVSPRVENAKLDERILSYFDIERNQYPHKASELADALNTEDLQMQMALTRMHTAGEIAKAQVWAKGTQDKASFVLWAPTTEWFTL